MLEFHPPELCAKLCGNLLPQPELTKTPSKYAHLAISWFSNFRHLSVECPPQVIRISCIFFPSAPVPTNLSLLVTVPSKRLSSYCHTFLPPSPLNISKRQFSDTDVSLYFDFRIPLSLNGGWLPNKLNHIYTPSNPNQNKPNQWTNIMRTFLVFKRILQWEMGELGLWFQMTNLSSFWLSRPNWITLLPAASCKGSRKCLLMNMLKLY